MKHLFLRQMLDWHMECEHNWSVAPGALGKGLKKWLRPELWEELESTYTGAEEWRIIGMRCCIRLRCSARQPRKWVHNWGTPIPKI